MDAQISFIRQLIDDTTVPYTYSDADLRDAITKAIDPTPVALPADVRAAALATFRRFAQS